MEKNYRLTPDLVETIRNGRRPPPILLEMLDKRIMLVSTTLEDAKVEAVEVIKDEVAEHYKDWSSFFKKNIAYRLYHWNPYLMQDTKDAWTPFYRGFCDITDSAPHHVLVFFWIGEEPHYHPVFTAYYESEYVDKAEESIAIRAAVAKWKPGQMVDYEIYATYDEKGDTLDEWILYHKGSFRLNPQKLEKTYLEKFKYPKNESEEFKYSKNELGPYL